MPLSKEKYREYRKKYDVEHKDEIQAYMKKYREEHGDDLRKKSRDAYKQMKINGTVVKNKKKTKAQEKQEKIAFEKIQQEYKQRMKSLGIDVEYQENIVIYITSQHINEEDEAVINRHEWHNERQYKRDIKMPLIYITTLKKSNYLHRQLYLKYTEFSDILGQDVEILKKLTNFDFFS